MAHSLPANRTVTVPKFVKYIGVSGESTWPTTRGKHQPRNHNYLSLRPTYDQAVTSVKEWLPHAKPQVIEIEFTPRGVQYFMDAQYLCSVGEGWYRFWADIPCSKFLDAEGNVLFELFEGKPEVHADTSLHQLQLVPRAK